MPPSSQGWAVNGSQLLLCSFSSPALENFTGKVDQAWFLPMHAKYSCVFECMDWIFFCYVVCSGSPVTPQEGESYAKDGVSVLANQVSKTTSLLYCKVELNSQCISLCLVLQTAWTLKRYWHKVFMAVEFNFWCYWHTLLEGHWKCTKWKLA